MVLETIVLPLHQRYILAGVAGLEPTTTESKSVVLPITPHPNVCTLFISHTSNSTFDQPSECSNNKKERKVNLIEHLTYEISIEFNGADDRT